MRHRNSPKSTPPYTRKDQTSMTSNNINLSTFDRITGLSQFGER